MEPTSSTEHHVHNENGGNRNTDTDSIEKIFESKKVLPWQNQLTWYGGNTDLRSRSRKCSVSLDSLAISAVNKGGDSHVAGIELIATKHTILQFRNNKAECCGLQRWVRRF
ncbi:hypothetical protein Hanom_Chr06g00563851 [Helianthus anomalus]